jgi:hypothetical protein
LVTNIFNGTKNVQNFPLWNDDLDGHLVQNSVKKIGKNESPSSLTFGPINVKKTLLLKGKYDKEKMCQISLNTYSHNEPYDLQAQVIFQKKSL